MVQSRVQAKVGTILFSHSYEQNICQSWRAGAASGKDTEPRAPVKHNQEETQGQHSHQATQPHPPAHPLIPLDILVRQESQAGSNCCSLIVKTCQAHQHLQYMTVRTVKSHNQRAACLLSSMTRLSGGWQRRDWGVLVEKKEVISPGDGSLRKHVSIVL